MSDFKNKTITNKGLELLSKAMAGGSIKFTKMQMGSGAFAGDLAAQDALVTVQNTLNLTNIVRRGSQVEISATLKPSDIIVEYDWTEIGVFAQGDDGIEILYMYGHTNNSSFISQGSLNEKLINVTVLVSNAANVTANINNSLVFLTKQDLIDHDNDPAAHDDIRQLIKNINVKVDVEEVINRRVNDDLGQPLNKIVEGYKNDLIASIGSLPQKAQWTDARAAAIDTINTNTAINNNANNTGTLSQKLSYISNNLIGATGNTGGSATAGTVMGKLNNITNITTQLLSRGGGIIGSNMLYERVVVGGFHATYSTEIIKEYNNAKGGMVRIASSTGSGNTRSITVTVDGKVVINAANPSSLYDFVPANQARATGKQLDIPFNSSFKIEAEIMQGVEFDLVYYINA